MHREELVGIQTIWWVDYQLAVGFLTGSWKSNMDVWISNQLFGNPTAWLSWPRCNGEMVCISKLIHMFTHFGFARQKRFKKCPSLMKLLPRYDDYHI